MDHLDQDKTLSIKWYILNEYANGSILSEDLAKHVGKLVKENWEYIDEDLKKYVEFDEDLYEIKVIDWPKNIKIVYNDIMADLN